MDAIAIKRVYDPPARGDGFRVLVDRLWPRGLKKADARVHHWAKDLAPTPSLRLWFSHDAAKLERFSTRYRRELEAKRDAAHALLNAARGRKLTLLYGARDPTCNHALVLRDFLAAL